MQHKYMPCLSAPEPNDYPLSLFQYITAEKLHFHHPKFAHACVIEPIIILAARGYRKFNKTVYAATRGSRPSQEGVSLRGTPGLMTGLERVIRD